MNSNMKKALDKILDNEKLFEEFSKLEDEMSVYEFCTRISGDFSKEEFKKGLKEIMDFEKSRLDLEELNNVAAGVKDWSKIVPAGLAALTAISGVLPNASAYEAKLLDRLANIDKSTVKKIAIGGGIGGIGLGTLVLAGYIYSNRLPDFEKLDKSIKRLRIRLHGPAKTAVDYIISGMNSDLINRLNEKFPAVARGKKADEGRILLFDRDILELVVANRSYFEKDTKNVLKFFKYLEKIAPRSRFMGLRNPGLYCYLNSTIQLLGSDPDLCNVLRSADSLGNYFNEWSRNNLESMQQELNDVQDEIVRLDQQLTRSATAIINLLNESFRNGELNILPEDVRNNITEVVSVTGFHSNLTRELAKTSENSNWRYASALQYNGIVPSESATAYTIVSRLFHDEQQRNRFNNLVNRFLEEYGNSGYGDKCILKANLLGGIANVNNREIALGQWADPGSIQLIEKFSELTQHVNSPSNSIEIPSSRDLVDNLPPVQNWNEQQDACDAIRQGLRIPEFLMPTVTIGPDRGRFDPVNGLNLVSKSHPFVLVNTVRGANGIVHGDIDMNLHERVVRNDGTQYELIGFACHIGNANGGHWYAVRKDKLGEWWQCDDSLVSSVGDSQQCLNNPYYRRVASALLYKRVQ